MANANPALQSLALDLGWPSYQQSTVERWQQGQRSIEQDYIAEEVPISLIYNGTPHVVMLATPTNLEEFALGFSITEGIIGTPQELLATRVYNRANGIEVQLKIPEHRFQCLADKGRNLTGRTGCGLCGSSTLQQAIRRPDPVYGDLTLDADELIAALTAIRQQQKINKLTGSVHAAAWAVPGAGIVAVREDVGRHNALDKLIGALLRTGKDPSTGFAIVTSRASYEMVQKTAWVKIPLLAAISAPTGLAIRLADEAGLTLIGFARADQHVIYTHPQRLTHNCSEKPMKIERLIKMTNDISDFFNAESDKEIAAEGVKNHLLRTWEPRMRQAIIAYCKENGEGLSDLAKTSVAKLG